jgi:hypothetical protein
MSGDPLFQLCRNQIPWLLKVLIVLSYSAALFLYLWDKTIPALIVAGLAAAVVSAFFFASTIIAPYNVSGMRIPPACCSG